MILPPASIEPGFWAQVKASQLEAAEEENRPEGVGCDVRRRYRAAVFSITSRFDHGKTLLTQTAVISPGDLPVASRV